MNKRAFTLIELLIVIGIIAILASAVIVAINPGQQFAAARDATRERHINSLHNSLISYQVANQGTWPDIDLPSEPTEICNTNLDPEPDCSADGLIDLSALTPNHINQIPVDPQGGDHDNGIGYSIMEGSVILIADNYETKFIAKGMSEEDFLDEVWDENFLLSVEVIGDNSGVVNSDPIGIECGDEHSSCESSFEEGEITLEIEDHGCPDLITWSEDCSHCEDGGTCDIFLENDSQCQVDKGDSGSFCPR